MRLIVTAICSILPIIAAETPVRVLPGMSPPPVPALEGVAVSDLPERQAAAPQVYTIGDVKGDEQLYVELINRSRANPAAEVHLALQNPDVLAAVNFFGTFPLSAKTNGLVAAFGLIPAVPPVAINAKLVTASRRHVQDMKTTVGQSHTGSDGSRPWERAGDAGYTGSIGENIYTASEYTTFGHWGFDVDWGNTTSGIQEPPGHRNVIHNANYREVGVAVDGGSGTVGGWKIGPQVVAQLFGSQLNSPGFLTGVVYYDENGNNFYDVGEGIGNATVAIAGSDASAVTALSGGYSLPLANGNYTAVISVPNGPSHTNAFAIVDNTNVKLDFSPPYTPPVVTDSTFAIGSGSELNFSGVPGASRYKVKQFQLIQAPVEGAENAAATTTITTTSDYAAVVDAGVNGSKAFHLATVLQDEFLPPPQVVRLNGTYYVEAHSELEFQSKVGVATSEQFAAVEVSADGGQTWQTVYNQAGASTPGGQPLAGETTFIKRQLSLGSFNGKMINVRFVWDIDFNTGFVWDTAQLTRGWLIDEIILRDAPLVSNQTVRESTENSIEVSASEEGTFGFQVQPITGSEPLPYGPLRLVNAVFPPPVFGIQSIVKVASREFDIFFTLQQGKPPSSFNVERRAKLSTAWSVDLNAQVTSLGNNQYRAKVTTGRADTTYFFRIKATP